MKNMKKQTVFAILLICIVAMFVVGCKGKQSASGDNYPIEISVFIGGGSQPSANNKMYKYLQEKFNVTFSWDILVGDLYQKRGTMIAGGVYPDLIEINETAFIDAGAVIPLDDLFDKYGPRLKAHYAENWGKMRHTDGKVYCMVNYGVIHGVEQGAFYNGSAFWVQKAVLKDAGYPKIATVDQFFDMIANYYKKNPTIDGRPTIPFTVITEDWRAFELWNPPNFLAGYPNEGNGIVDPVTHEYKAFFTHDISKRWFKILNQMNAQGLIDRSAFTDNYDQYSAKISTGRALSLFGQQWQFDGAEASKVDRNENIRTMAPLPVVFDANITPKYRTESIPNLGRGFGISVSAKDPVRIVRFLNDYMAEDNLRTIQWGIEGEDWQYNAQGVPYRTQQQRENWQSQSWADANRASLWAGMAPKLEGSFSDGYPSDLGDLYSEREAMLRPEDRELFNAYGVNGFAQMMAKEPQKNSIWYPTWNMVNPPDGSAAQIALQRCEQTMKRLLPQLILAPPANFDRLWNEYVREMEVTNNIAEYEKYMTSMVAQRIKDWS
jgi:putative aldouronate transport system substrate-binding protein